MVDCTWHEIVHMRQRIAELESEVQRLGNIITTQADEIARLAKGTRYPQWKIDLFRNRESRDPRPARAPGA